MPESVYELAVVIDAIDRWSGPLRKMDAATGYSKKQIDNLTKSMRMVGASNVEINRLTGSLNKLGRDRSTEKLARDLQAVGATRDQISQVATGMDKLAKAQERMHKAQNVAIAGAVTTGVGVLGADALLKAVNLAGEFQSQLVTIQDITGATNKEMQGLGDTVMNVAAQVSRFNDMQVSGFAQQLASGGFPKLADVNKLLLPVSQFADAQMYEGKTSDASAAVNMAIGMAHTFGHYDARSLTQFLDTFNKFSVMQPGNSEELNQTLTYLAPTAFRMMHMRESDVMAMAALANRVGLNGSHGGTNAADMVLRLIPGLVGGMPTKKKTPAAWAAMTQLGLIDASGNSKFFKNGQITNFQGMIQTLVGASKGRTPEQMTALYKSIFGIQGGRAAALFSDPKVIQQLQAMDKQFGQTKSMEQIQHDQQNTPQGQMNQLRSNGMSALIRFSQALGPVLNPVLNTLNKLLGSFLKYEQANPRLMKVAATFVTIATMSLLVVGPLLMLAGALGMLVLSLGKGGAIRTGIGFAGRIAGAPIRGIMSGGRAIGSGALKVGSMAADFGKVAVQATIATAKMVAFGAATAAVKTAQLIAAAAAKIWRLAMIGLDVVLDANPISLIIMAIAALITIIVLVVTHWKQVSKVISEVWIKMKQFGADIAGTFTKLWHDAVSWGENIVKGIWNGIVGLASWLKSKILGWISNVIPGPIKKALGINSPSKLMQEYGMYTAQGLALGMMNHSGVVTHAANHLATSAVPDIRGSVGGHGSPFIGELHIHANSAEDGRAAANAFLNHLGNSARQNNMSRPFGPNRMVFGH